MRALIMVLTSSVPSPTYALCEIFPFQACAEVGGPTQTALLNRKMRARLWDELRPGPRNRGQDPKTALSWPEPCAGIVLEGTHNLGTMPAALTDGLTASEKGAGRRTLV